MNVPFMPHICHKKLVGFLLIVSYWLSASVATWAQTGYIYLHNRSFNEESGVNFTYSVSGGPTTVSSLTLNDQATTLTPISGLGGGAGGGLWALADAADANGNYAVYYRAPNTSAWVSRTGRLSNIDGGATGARIGIATISNRGYIYYDNGTTETDVTGNLSVSVTDVSDNWQGIQYAVLSNNQVWRRSTTSTSPVTWTLVSGISARSVDAIPNTTNQFIYKSVTTEDIIRVNGDGTSTNLGFPANAGSGTEIAATENGTIFARFGDFTYRYTGTGWVVESTSQLLGFLTGGPLSQIWARLPNFAGGMRDRIYSRTETGIFLSDENVRTSPNDNSALIAVAAGTYTITEAAVQGWDLNGITFYESRTPSSSNVATNTASVVVSAGEVVHVVFENALVQTTPISNVCSTSATFTETFGTGTGYGGPLLGLTGYHYASGGYGFGYYSLANTTSLMGGYAGNFTDHTGNTNGRMLAVDATSEPGVFYRRRFTGLLTGGVYTFSAWAMNVNTQGAPDLPNISFEVYDPDSGTLISSGNSGNISAVGVWQQTSLLFTANQSMVDLVLRNNTTGTSGNDLAIDDISFGVAIPQPTVQKTDATCSTAGSLTIASPVSTGYEYSINGSTYQTSPVFTNVAPGSYSVTARYTSSTGCVSPIRAVTIAVTNQSSFTTALTSATITNGNSATLTTSSNGTIGSYRFSTGLTNTTGTLIVSPTTLGSNPYSVTATSSQGCSATASATVTVVVAPVPTSLTISGQPNPGGTVGVAVPPMSFTGTISSGTISTVRYTEFPTNVSSITIGTTVYTSTNFPAGGVTAPVGTSVLIDPIDGATTATIPFRLISSAGGESTTTGTVGVPFLVVTDFCNSQILFFNEDFGAGTGFGPPFSTTATVPGYTYRNTDPINDGQYGIVNNPDQGDDFGGASNNVWLHGPDHTGNPNGRMLLINGSNPGQTAYSQTINGLTIGRAYAVRAYITNLINPAVIPNSVLPNLIFQVTSSASANSTTLAQNNTGDIATTNTLTWIPYSLSFTATTNSVNFRLISSAPAANGNDFALDDIQFFEVIQPVLSTTAITSTCPTTSASLAGITTSNQPASTTLTWHSSVSATAGNRIADVTALTSGTYYAAFFDGTCFTKTSPFVVLIVPCANPDAGLTISAGTSGTVVANIAANDFVNGQPATLGTNGNATVAQIGTYPTGVTLNTTTGSLSVAAGTTPGSYTVTYQLCDKLSPVNCTTALATFTVSPTLSGTVYNDGNGLTNNLIDGTGTNAGGLYVILTNSASTSVLANALVSTAGTYSFTGLTAGTYSVRLSTTSAVVGTTPPAASIPSAYTFVGEGTAAAGDGTPNGITAVTLTATASLTSVNFGLDQIPVSTSITLTSQINPGGLTSVTIPPASFTGTDADGSITTIHFTAFPSNANSITIGGTTYLLNIGIGIPGTLLFPTSGGVTVAAGTAVSVDPIDGNVTVVIPFRVIDNAGVESTTTGAVSVPFTGLSVTGTIFNDGNGLSDNTISGTGTNAGGLFVNLVNTSGNVVAFQAVPATGVYSFTGVAASTYSVRLSTTTAAIGSTAPTVSVPTGWTFTGEGTTAAGDGTPNGIISVTVATASITNANFGLDQLPVPTSSTLAAQANPGGTNAVSVPPASFTGTDADGTINAIRYTTFPTNVTSLTIGTTTYTSFPAGGVTAAAGSAVRIDPVDRAVTVSIDFRAIDNAGQESTATGTVSVPFTYVITANPDAGTVSAGTGGTPVANVAGNDFVNGQAANLTTNATVSPLGTYPTGVTLNTTTGSLSVAAGTAPGSYTVAYQLCDRLSPPTCATALVSFTVTPGIGGTVVNDVNGLTDNTINGTGTNAGGLFAILINSANTVVASLSVSPAGLYRFDNVAPGIYGVQLSTAAGTIGSAPPAISLPTNWTSTGEGITAAGDGLANGITSVTVGSGEVTGVNFGVEQLPTSISATLAAQANPGGTNAIAIPSSSFAGTDPDGTVVAIRYVSFPTNVTTMYIDGVAYTSVTFPPGGVTAATNVSVYIDPVDGTGGVVIPVIPFRVVDNAGMASATVATVTVPFTCYVALCPPVTGQKIMIR
ncbi:beta strand repeat-containing protein [Spirosoma pomorum]